MEINFKSGLHFMNEKEKENIILDIDFKMNHYAFNVNILKFK